jgi:formylglycine-generating enzyme required for sulfatase activity
MHATKVAVAVAVVVIGTMLPGGGCGRKTSPGTVAPLSQATIVPITNMILVKAGAFLRQNQQVILSRDYWLGKYEVTQGEFLALTGRNPSHFTGDSNRPVEKVTFLEAAAYCAELTRRQREAGRLPPDYLYRLPTEAEWEYACRAGGSGQFSFGDDVAAAGDHAWTEENSDGMTHPAGLKAPNAWGFHDLHGNVWEWCQDWFGEYPKEPRTDPTGPPAGKFKVFRGGGWSHAAKFARISSRFMMSPSNGIDFVGFRVALAPALPKAR